MADSLSVSFDAKQFVADVSKASSEVKAKAPGIVKKALQNTKDDAIAEARQIGPRASRYASSITYDFDLTAGGAAGEVGPDNNRKQGNLGVVFEYGAASQNTSPHPHLMPAFEKEAPNFEKWMGELVDGAL